MCIAPATIFIPASPTQSLPFALSTTAITRYISFSSPFCARVCKETREYSVIFSISRTIALALLKYVLFQLMNTQYNTRISVPWEVVITEIEGVRGIVQINTMANFEY